MNFQNKLVSNKPKSTSQHYSTFHSKIMLFGEYGIIKNSMGLSIPYTHYSGTLSYVSGKKHNPEAHKSNIALQSYLRYLWSLKKTGALSLDLNLSKFENDLYNGLYFDSSIPQGFGVGSSGALCAALYDHYASEKINRKNPTADELIELRNIFGQMESYYHGKSSGLDPLICYLKLPVLLKSKTEIQSIKLPENTTQNGMIFLLDTGMSSKTQPLVHWFAEKCKQSSFNHLFSDLFIPNNDACINQFLKGEIQALFQSLHYW